MKALILGITGQDGSYLAEHLLSLGYEVHGMVRRSSTGNLQNIQHILDRITLHQGDMLDPVSVGNIISLVEPQEIYNEADQDNVDFSYSTPAYSMAITAGAVANLLELVRVIDNTIQIFQPLSAMMFGYNGEPFQTMDSEFAPQSPYGVGKVAAYYLCQHYQREHRLRIITATLFNHESVRRDERYLLHMICSKAVKWSMDLSQEKIRIANPEGFVDIGHAPDYVEMFPKMLHDQRPYNYILGSGKRYLIHDLCQSALQMVGLEYEKCVEERSDLARPGKHPDLIGDNSCAKRILGYAPKIDAMGMVGILIGHYQQKYKLEKRNSK